MYLIFHWQLYCNKDAIGKPAQIWCHNTFEDGAMYSFIPVEFLICRCSFTVASFNNESVLFIRIANTIIAMSYYNTQSIISNAVLLCIRISCATLMPYTCTYVPSIYLHVLFILANYNLQFVFTLNNTIYICTT